MQIIQDSLTACGEIGVRSGIEVGRNSQEQKREAWTLAQDLGLDARALAVGEMGTFCGDS